MNQVIPAGRAITLIGGTIVEQITTTVPECMAEIGMMMMKTEAVGATGATRTGITTATSLKGWVKK
jgi:hypothetical protein